MTTTQPEPSRLIERIQPKTSVRVQLFCAAAMWTIGASILTIRGVGYLHDRYWHAWILAIGLAIGVVKSRYLLDRIARAAVDRIRAQGRAPFLTFFSAKSWLLVGLMMGGGIVIRNIFVHPNVIGAGILGAVYVGVGTALALADRIFWQAFAAGDKQADAATSVVEGCVDPEPAPAVE